MPCSCHYCAVTGVKRRGLWDLGKYDPDYAGTIVCGECRTDFVEWLREEERADPWNAGAITDDGDDYLLGQIYSDAAW